MSELIIKFKNDLISISKKNRIPLFISIFIWYISIFFRLDRSLGFFNYSKEGAVYWIVKFIYLIILSFLICSVFNLKSYINKYKNNSNFHRGVNFFILYFFIMIILILAIWPGTWSWDDIIILQGVRRYSLEAWQHFLTSFFQMLILQFLPFSGGYIILQNMIISIIVAYVVIKLELSFNLRISNANTIDMFLKLLPFFVLTPVLLYQFSGYRCGILAYLQLLFVCMIVTKSREDTLWSAKYLLSFCCVTVLLSSWRSENLFFILLGLLVLVFQKKQNVSLRKKILGTIFIIFTFLGITKFQNKLLGNDNYNITGTILPCCELLRFADSESDKEVISKIDRVLNVEFILNNPDMGGEAVFWSENGVRKGYSKEDYKEYFNSFIILASKYPFIVIKERCGLLFRTSSAKGKTNRTNVEASSEFFHVDVSGHDALKDFQGERLNTPPRKNVRKNIIRIMGAMKKDYTPNVLYPFVWNIIVPICIFIFASFYFLINRKREYLIICIFILMKTFFVFLTAPAPYFMYYINEYLLGYFLLYYFILYKLYTVRQRFRLIR